MSQLINSGIELMLYGMGFVFIFLVVLILATTLMSFLVRHFTPEKTEEPAISTTVTASSNDPANDPLLLDIISEAIKQHRARR